MDEGNVLGGEWAGGEGVEVGVGSGGGVGQGGVVAQKASLGNTRGQGGQECSPREPSNRTNPRAMSWRTARPPGHHPGVQLLVEVEHGAGGAEGPWASRDSNDQRSLIQMLKKTHMTPENEFFGKHMYNPLIGRE